MLHDVILYCKNLIHTHHSLVYPFKKASYLKRKAAFVLVNIQMCLSRGCSEAPEGVLCLYTSLNPSLYSVLACCLTNVSLFSRKLQMCCKLPLYVKRDIRWRGLLNCH